MLRKNKIIIALAIVCSIALTLGLVLGGLDKLDVEKYGINYNYVTANFSDHTVYEGGLHLVGPSNVLLQVPKTEQTITIKNIKTYTQDFFPLQLEVQARYKIYLKPSNNEQQNFQVLRNFYINFGGQPQTILDPLIKNQVIKIGSSLSSSYYQSSNNYQSFESQVKTTVEQIVNNWSSVSITILLSSIVCRGVSTNLQPQNRKIYGLISQLQRTQTRKTDMTHLINTLGQTTRIRMQVIKNGIARRIAVGKALADGQFTGAATVLSNIEAVAQELPYASSQLYLRPQLYLINNSTPF